ncbi:MAG: hypothetical protein A2X28_07550 [Elusimicrobia bacterium GWA2_56_46]|nr:MAG: hypothetical protein A2X28_07550 [Elusimicrobia bacterium GWA2_56_46]OGR55660.1 MAG: hypothetical protein A2X39_04675 [Elusimicrobia bacterium GWC2_56_31]
MSFNGRRTRLKTSAEKARAEANPAAATTIKMPGMQLWRPALHAPARNTAGEAIAARLRKKTVFSLIVYERRIPQATGYLAALSYEYIIKGGDG